MKMVYLNDISESIEYGVTASASETKTGPKFLRITDIQNGSVNWDTVPYCNAEPSKLSSARLRSGDIVFARTGATTGKSFLIRHCPDQAVFASYLIRVRPSKDVDPSYLGHFFDSKEYWRQITLKASGAAQPGVNASKLKEIAIPLPPLDEQKRIAGILDQADALRRLRARALDKLGTLGQAIFHEMFWDVQRKRLDDLTKKITDGTHQAPEWAEDGVPFVFVSNIRNQEISLKTSKFVTPDEYDRLIKRTALAEGDVVYTCVGSYGNSAVVDTNTDFVFQRHIAHIKPDLQHLDSVFLSYGLESPLVRAQADKTATGIAQKTVTLSALKNFEFPAPDVDAQIAFRGRIDDLKASRISARKALEQSESLFTALQHRAFRGEL